MTLDTDTTGKSGQQPHISPAECQAIMANLAELREQVATLTTAKTAHPDTGQAKPDAEQAARSEDKPPPPTPAGFLEFLDAKLNKLLETKYDLRGAAEAGVTP